MRRITSLRRARGGDARVLEQSLDCNATAWFVCIEKQVDPPLGPLSGKVQCIMPSNMLNAVRLDTYLCVNRAVPGV
jgi:hypothetical protein